MSQTKMWRQGDVLIRRVHSIPKDAKQVPRENGRVVLAHGEVTGHAHAIAEPAAALWETKGGKHYLRIDGPATVRHEEHTAIALKPGTYEVVRQREYLPESIRNVAD